MKTIWCSLCALVGAAAFGIGIQLWLDSIVLSVVMACVGFVLGWGFGKLVPAHELLIDLLG